MTREEKTNDLLNFAQYMDEVEDDFAEINKVKKEIENKKGGAYSLWGRFLSFLSRGCFLYSFLSIYVSICLKIRHQNIAELSLFEGGFCKVLMPIPFIFVLTLILAGLFLYWSKIETKKQIQEIKLLETLKAKFNDLFQNIKEQYDGYENPPVSLEYSNPYFLLDLIDYIENSNNDISINDAITIISKKN